MLDESLQNNPKFITDNINTANINRHYRMTIANNSRKIGINISVPFNLIFEIDKRAKQLGYPKRSNYILDLINKDLNQ